jgi:hypothetical protein
MGLGCHLVATDRISSPRISRPKHRFLLWGRCYRCSGVASNDARFLSKVIAILAFSVLPTRIVQ